jgi:hypothetical protein
MARPDGAPSAAVHQTRLADMLARRNSRPTRPAGFCPRHRGNAKQWTVNANAINAKDRVPFSYASDRDQTLSVAEDQLGLSGIVRDL